MLQRQLGMIVQVSLMGWLAETASWLATAALLAPVDSLNLLWGPLLKISFWQGAWELPQECLQCLLHRLAPPSALGRMLESELESALALELAMELKLYLGPEEVFVGTARFVLLRFAHVMGTWPHHSEARIAVETRQWRAKLPVRPFSLQLQPEQLAVGCAQQRDAQLVRQSAVQVLLPARRPPPVQAGKRHFHASSRTCK